MKKMTKLLVICFLVLTAVKSNAQSFQTTTPFTNARYGHSSAKSLNDNVLIFGGTIASGSMISSVFEYNLASDTWTAKASIPNANGLSNSACVRLNTGHIILFGGTVNGSQGQSNKAFKYNINSDSWENLNNLPNSYGRERMCATLINDSIVLLTGGISTISGNLTYPTTCYLYHILSDSYTYAGDLSFGVINQTSTLLPNGEVLITGGFDGGAAHNKVYVYNLQNGLRTLTTSLNTAVSSHSAVLVNGIVYIYGGFSIPLFEFSSELHKYNPADDAVTLITNGPVACSQFAMVHFGSTILIAGGGKILPNGSFGVTDEAYLYNVNNNTFSTISTMPSTRAGMEITELGSSGKFIFSGGHMTLSEPFDDAIIYDATLAVGINENILSNSLEVYPNPCQNELNLKINPSGYSNKYEVFNSLGQIVQSGEIEFNNSSINTSQLLQGFYIISINGNTHQRFQVVR